MILVETVTIKYPPCAINGYTIGGGVNYDTLFNSNNLLNLALKPKRINHLYIFLNDKHNIKPI